MIIAVFILYVSFNHSFLKNNIEATDGCKVDKSLRENL